MIRWLTPVRATKLVDIQIREQLLNRFPQDWRRGYELILLEDDYKRLVNITKHLQSYSQYSVASVHAPFPQATQDHTAYDLRTASGQEKLAATAAIAQAIGATKVVVHSQLAFSLIDWQLDWNTTQWRDQLFTTIFTIIQNIAQQYPEIQFCLENMPLPLFPDTVVDAKNMRYNPCIMTFQDMQRAQAGGISITLDICHYDMMRRLWHQWLEQDHIIDQSIIAERDHIVGVYPESRQPDYLTLVQSLGSTVAHIQLADSRGVWQNKARQPISGLPLGTGEINRSELYTLLNSLHVAPAEYTITLEIVDSDLRNLVESEQTIEYLIRLLT